MPVKIFSTAYKFSEAAAKAHRSTSQHKSRVYLLKVSQLILDPVFDHKLVMYVIRFIFLAKLLSTVN